MNEKPNERDRAPWLDLGLSVMRRHAPGREQWHYEHGLMLGALEAAGLRSGREDFRAFVRAYMESLVSPDGTIRGYRHDEYNLDQINPGKILFGLLSATGDPRWKAALDALRGQLAGQPRTPSGGFWHKGIYPDQMWLDGLYMQGPFMARYAREFDRAEDSDEAVRQLSLMELKARDPATGLLYHAWDESRQQLWADPETGCSPHFWSRAMGWYAMAVVDVLDWLPSGHAGIVELRAILSRLAKAVSRVQDERSGLWFQVLDQGRRAGNYPESSGSCMFVYALAKGLRLGHLRDDEGSTERMLAKAWQGLLAGPFRLGADGEYHLDGICGVAGLGGKPYRDGSYRYYVGEKAVSDDYKGVGPFILAGLEMEEASIRTRGTIAAGTGAA